MDSDDRYDDDGYTRIGIWGRRKYCDGGNCGKCRLCGLERRNEYRILSNLQNKHTKHNNMLLKYGYSSEQLLTFVEYLRFLISYHVEKRKYHDFKEYYDWINNYINNN